MEKEKIERFIKKSKTVGTYEEFLDLIEKSTYFTEGSNGFLAWMETADMVMLTAGDATDVTDEMYDVLKRNYKNKPIFFITQRNPKAWEKFLKGKVRYHGHLMEVI